MVVWISQIEFWPLPETLVLSVDVDDVDPAVVVLGTVMSSCVDELDVDGLAWA